MAAASVERRFRSYSQGDAVNYALAIHTGSIKEEEIALLYESKHNTILEDYEVDVAILLSQMNHHKIDLDERQSRSTRARSNSVTLRSAAFRLPSRDDMFIVCLYTE